MRHRAFTLWEALVVIAIVAISAAILFPPHHNGTRESARRSSCQSNLKQIGLAIKQYAQDYDQRQPSAREAATGGWAGAVQPYLKSWPVFQCPSDSSEVAQTTDYFYNARLSGVRYSKLGDARLTILVGDGMGNQCACASLLALPGAWKTDQSSPAWRHLDGANYLFADAHVKWFKPGKITLDKPAKNVPTFLLGP